MIETVTVPGIADPWTLFWDMHSGGGLKLPPYHYIYIQADEEEARRIFEEKFGRSSFGQACDTCGPNWSVSTVSTLRAATSFERKARHDLDQDGNEQPFFDGSYGYSRPIQSLEDFLERPDVLVIYVEKQEDETC